MGGRENDRMRDRSGRDLERERVRTIIRETAVEKHRASHREREAWLERER